jgi:hypothetical protein
MGEDKKLLCAKHPEKNATLSCERCGDFICDGCVKIVGKRKVCEDCTQIDGINYLDNYKRSIWGKRDGFVWLFGGLGTVFSAGYTVLFLFLAITAFASGASNPEQGFYLLIPSIVFGLIFVIDLSYLLLKKWARFGLLFLPVLQVLPSLIVTSMEGGDAENMGRTCGASIIPFVFVVSAFASSRNRLAFKIDVSEAKLERLYQIYIDNGAARYGQLLSVVGFLLPPFLLVALVLSIVGLRRVDSEAWPPVGGKSKAIRGLLISILGILGWIGILIAIYTA